MSIMEAIGKLRLLVSKQSRPLVSYFSIQGPITAETAYEVNENLKRVPKNTKKLALIINSSGGGEISQAHIISEKIKKKAKDLNVQLITFGEEFALNCGFFLLTQGNRVYADYTTFVGGIQVGKSKLSTGVLSEYMSNVVYAEHNTYAAELKKDEPFQESKATEMRELFSLFSQEMKQKILSTRKNASEVDLTKFYYAQEAKKLGLIDEVGRLHQTMPKILEGCRIQLVKQPQMKALMSNLRNLKLSS